MMYSYEWLKELLPDIPEPHTLMERLTVHSVEVEGIESQGEQLNNVVLGVIQSIEKHPNADRLSVCMVDIGDTQEQIVCGGSNLSEGMKVAVAKIGAQVQWHGEGELITLEPVKIRGVESRGMICGADEIGLASEFPKESEKEIVDLSKCEYPAGTLLAEVLDKNSICIDIDNKSMTHRSDLFSHRGMAREIAAVFNLSYTEPQIAPLTDKGSSSLQVDIQESELCPRYMAVECTVQMHKTPDFIANRLQECGVKSINVVVDITNYVMLEYGQPLHAFDADHIPDNQIIVRRAQQKESLVTLDHEKKDLADSVLVIANTTKAIAIAGVIGGEESGVNESTTRIILEVATFDSVSVRKAAQHIGVRTDSALRYEKGLPTELPTIAAARAVELLKQYAEAEIVSMTDSHPMDSTLQYYRAPILFSLQHFQRLAGSTIDRDTSIALLERLGCAVSSADTLQLGAVNEERPLHVSPPWFRKDLNIPEDLIEEIVRLYGVNNIPEQQLVGTLDVPTHQKELPVLWNIRDELQSFGLSEVYNYSFYGEELMKKVGYQPDKEHIEIANPLSEDARYLRVNLLPRLLENISKNQHYQDTFSLFEIGHVYFADREVIQLGIVVVDDAQPYRKIRGIVEALLRNLNIVSTSEIIVQTVPCEFWGMYSQNQALRIDIHGETVGTIGEVDMAVLQQMDISKNVGFATLSIPILAKHTTSHKNMQPISPYPAIPLDLSIIIPQEVEWIDIEKTVQEKAGEMLQTIDVFDVYTGSKIPVNKKSISFHIVMQSDTKTLEMTAMEQWRDELMQLLSKKYQAQLRDK